MTTTTPNPETIDKVDLLTLQLAISVAEGAAHRALAEKRRVLLAYGLGPKDDIDLQTGRIKRAPRPPLHAVPAPAPASNEGGGDAGA